MIDDVNVDQCLIYMLKITFNLFVKAGLENEELECHPRCFAADNRRESKKEKCKKRK